MMSFLVATLLFSKTRSTYIPLSKPDKFNSLPKMVVSKTWVPRTSYINIFFGAFSAVLIYTLPWVTGFGYSLKPSISPLLWVC